LNHVISQISRIEEYWRAENTENVCVFILAGDFNFYHKPMLHKDRGREQAFLEKQGFVPTKSGGYTRPHLNQPQETAGGSDPSNAESRQCTWAGERLVDNIWVKGTTKVREVVVREGSSTAQIEQSCYAGGLRKISDHYPVIAEIEF
jgi:endonuclease/exonuclease/phosphatase family metal-dependent hydrolase